MKFNLLEAIVILKLFGPFWFLIRSPLAKMIIKASSLISFSSLQKLLRHYKLQCCLSVAPLHFA